MPNTPKVVKWPTDSVLTNHMPDTNGLEKTIKMLGRHQLGYAARVTCSLYSPQYEACHSHGEHDGGVCASWESHAARNALRDDCTEDKVVTLILSCWATVRATVHYVLCASVQGMRRRPRARTRPVEHSVGCFGHLRLCALSMHVTSHNHLAARGATVTRLWVSVPSDRSSHRRETPSHANGQKERSRD